MERSVKPIVYGVKHRDEFVRGASRSGGVFTALSDYILDKGGIIYGCVMDNCVEAVHKRAETAEERDMMRGSKYIQSNMGDTFKLVKNDVDLGRDIMFTGTPCQIAGLQSFLGKDKDKVIYVDIACHGVPSPMIWKDYVRWNEARFKQTCSKVDFRDKTKFGWEAHVETLVLENEGKELRVSDNVFAKLFCEHNVLRPSCYECPYRSVQRTGDITLADFWGISRVNAEFNDNKGVSLVLINTERGLSFFEKVKDELNWFTTSIENSMQPAFRDFWSIPKTRDTFWKEYNNKDFSFIARKYGGFGIVAHTRKKVAHYLVRLKRKLRLE